MYRTFIAFTLVLSVFQANAQTKSFPYNSVVDSAVAKAIRTDAQFTNTEKFPRKVELGDTEWKTTKRTDWTSGFYAGNLWQLYMLSGDPKMKELAEKWTTPLFKCKDDRFSHDLGFQLELSYGWAYKNKSLTDEAKKALYDGSASLVSLYNPKVGTTKSWTWRKEWQHPTIIDNMMNLEMLFESAKRFNRKDWYQIADKHAATTLKNHIRPDFTTYHVVNYDTASGKVISRVTDQGAADNSTWARGQAWAIYGFTMAYRYTKKPQYLAAAEKLALKYINMLPEDYVPYWDFSMAMDGEPRDAAAATIATSGMIELASYLKPGKNKSLIVKTYTNTLNVLNDEPYTGLRTPNPSLLNHCTGAKPHKSEIDVSLIYADYYYIEALARYKKTFVAAKPQPKGKKKA